MAVRNRSESLYENPRNLHSSPLNKVNLNSKILDVHVILDNLSTHKTPAVQKWLLRHRRFHFHFTPTYGLWMNLVERWFSAFTTKKLKRSAHRSVAELATDIQAWADHWNETPPCSCGTRLPGDTSNASPAIRAAINEGADEQPQPIFTALQVPGDTSGPLR